MLSLTPGTQEFHVEQGHLFNDLLEALVVVHVSPGEGRDPANSSLDSGLRRKDARGEQVSHNLADV